jgi:hypothetical protein
MSGFCELRHEGGKNQIRAMVFYEQEGNMSNLRVFIWLTWLMGCKLAAELFAPASRQRRTTGEIA